MAAIASSLQACAIAQQAFFFRLAHQAASLHSKLLPLWPPQG
jgi:hypothetical protein